MAKKRIVQAWPGKARLVVLFAAGCALGVVNAVGLSEFRYGVLTTLPSGGRVTTMYPAGLYLTVFVIVPLAVIWLSFSEQRFVWAGLETLLFSGAAVVCFVVPALGLTALWPPAVALSIGFVVCSVMLRMLSLFAVRACFVRLIPWAELCEKCGHELTGKVSCVCPECGQPVRPPAPSP